MAKSPPRCHNMKGQNGSPNAFFLAVALAHSAYFSWLANYKVHSISFLASLNM